MKSNVNEIISSQIQLTKKKKKITSYNCAQTREKIQLHFIHCAYRKLDTKLIYFITIIIMLIIIMMFIFISSNIREIKSNLYLKEWARERKKRLFHSILNLKIRNLNGRKKKSLSFLLKNKKINNKDSKRRLVEWHLISF